MVSPQKLIYNNLEINVFLNTFDVILDVAFDSDSGETSSFLNRSATVSESYDGRYKNTHCYKYDELFSPRFTIVKKDFSDFSQSEVRKVLKYLTQTDKPALLEVSYDKDNETIVEEDKNFCAIGGWTEISTYKLANNRTVGIVATFEAVTPYAMSDILSYTISADNAYKKILKINTDDNKPVFPRITIQENGSVVNIPTNTTFSGILDMVDYVENTVYCNDTTHYWKTSEPVWRSATTAPNYDGWATVEVTRAYTEDDAYANNTFYHYADINMYYWVDPYSFHEASEDPNLQTTSVKITNKYYDVTGQVVVGSAIMIVKNNAPTEKIIVDGSNKVISSSSTKRIFDDDFVNWTWLPLYDGKNELTVEGNCTVTLEYREVRKVGEY
jgi:hypothetical protein